MDDYNFEHFGTRHLLHDLQGTVREQGLEPGSVAPDFQLVSVEGGSVRLSDLRGKPVLIHFGSFT